MSRKNKRIGGTHWWGRRGAGIRRTGIRIATSFLDRFRKWMTKRHEVDGTKAKKNNTERWTPSRNQKAGAFYMRRKYAQKKRITGLHWVSRRTVWRLDNGESGAMWNGFRWPVQIFHVKACLFSAARKDSRRGKADTWHTIRQKAKGTRIRGPYVWFHDHPNQDVKISPECSETICVYYFPWMTETVRGGGKRARTSADQRGPARMNEWWPINHASLLKTARIRGQRPSTTTVVTDVADA